MAKRITDKDLEQLCVVMNNLTDHKYDFSVEWAYGAPRLVRKKGSVDVSPRLPSGELTRWIRAFMGGWDLCQEDRIRTIIAETAANPGSGKLVCEHRRIEESARYGMTCIDCGDRVKVVSL